jgi:hypothetical protein
MLRSPQTRRLRARLERMVLGWFMGAVALLLERRLLKRRAR